MGIEFKLKKPLTVDQIPTADSIRRRQNLPHTFEDQIEAVIKGLQDALNNGTKEVRVYLPFPPDESLSRYRIWIQIMSEKGYSAIIGLDSPTQECWLDIYIN